MSSGPALDKPRPRGPELWGGAVNLPYHYRLVKATRPADPGTCKVWVMARFWATLTL